MKKTLRSGCLAYILLCSLPLCGQIPNSGFENWTNGSPDNWFCNNVPTVVSPIVQETPSHSGAYALRGEVTLFAGSPFTPLLSSTDPMANGFPVSQTFSTFSFYYKLNLTGTARCEASLSFYDAGNNWVGGGGLFLTGVVSSYTLMNIPLSYSGSNPVECVIIFSISDSVAANPPLGNYFVVDDLSFSGVSAVNGPDSAPFQAIAFPNPATDAVTLRAGNSGSGHAEVFVYDVFGKVVKNFTAYTKTGTSFEQDLSLAGLPAGVYPVKIVAGNKQWVTKIIRK